MGLAVGYLPVFPLCSPPVWCDWGARGVGLSLPERAPGVGWPVLPLWRLSSRSCLLLTCRSSEAAVVGDTESLWDVPRERPLLLSPGSSPTPWTASCPFGAPHTPPSLPCSSRVPSPLPDHSPPGFNLRHLWMHFFLLSFLPFSFLLPPLSSIPFLSSLLLSSPLPPPPFSSLFQELGCVFSVRLPPPSCP